MSWQGAHLLLARIHRLLLLLLLLALRHLADPRALTHLRSSWWSSLHMLLLLRHIDRHVPSIRNSLRRHEWSSRTRISRCSIHRYRLLSGSIRGCIRLRSFQLLLPFEVHRELGTDDAGATVIGKLFFDIGQEVEPSRDLVEARRRDLLQVRVGAHLASQRGGEEDRKRPSSLARADG